MPDLKMFAVRPDSVKPEDIFRFNDEFDGTSFFDGTSGDIDYFCGHCDAILFVNTSPGQVCGGGAIQCPACSGYNKLIIWHTENRADDRFDSSKTCINRGIEHALDFERKAREFCSGNAYSEVIEVDPETRENVRKLRLTKPMPSHLECIFSDAVSNLRAGMDHAVFATGNGGRHAAFPAARSKKDFDTSSRGWCKDAPDEIFGIISKFQPYKGGNDTLWVMHEIGNSHKHAVIRPLALATSSITYSGGIVYGGMLPRPPVWDSTKNEMEIFRQPEGGSTTDMKIEIDRFIAMGEVEIVAGQPAITVLNQFLWQSSAVVLDIEAEAIRLGLQPVI